jgi:hypothetical protein
MSEQQPQPSKAAILANELKVEKKRLEQELEELHTDYENKMDGSVHGRYWYLSVFSRT